MHLNLAARAAAAAVEIFRTVTLSRFTETGLGVHSPLCGRASRAAVMFVGAPVGVLAWQIHCRHDRADHALVSEQRESPGLFIEHDATAWRLLVLYVSGKGPQLKTDAASNKGHGD